MATLLHIDSSPRGPYSFSRVLSNAAVEAWRTHHPDGKVVVRDLTTTPMTFVDLDWIMGAFTPPEQHQESHKRAIAVSNEMVSEVLEADNIIIGVPLYIFNLPGILKAWIDHFVRAGKTFQYTPEGPKGLLSGKSVTVLIASAGQYLAGSPTASYDLLTPYLRLVFGFIGITDVRFVQAGGTAPVDQGKVDRDAFLAPFLEQVSALSF